MNTLSLIITGLSLVACLFYMIGAIGASDDADTIENVSWVTASAGNIDYYFGLKALAFDGEELKYSAKSCGSDACDECDESGETAEVMVILALLCAAVTAVVGVMGILGKEHKFISIAGIVAALLSILFGVIGFAEFDDCFDQIDRDMDDAAYGPGMALTLIAFLLMLVVAGIFIFQMFGAVISKAVGAKESPSK
jgi:hypothetical protein